MTIDWIYVKDRLPDALNEEHGDEDDMVWHVSDPVLAKNEAGTYMVVLYIPDDPAIGACWIDNNTYDTVFKIEKWTPLPKE